MMPRPACPGDCKNHAQCESSTDNRLVLVDAADRFGAAVIDVPIVGVWIAGEPGGAQGQRHRGRISCRAAVSTEPGQLLQANRDVTHTGKSSIGPVAAKLI